MPWHWWLVVVVWTVVANIAQYRLDIKHNPPFSPVVYALAHLSVLHYLAFSLCPYRAFRWILVAANAAAAAYLAFEVLLASPITKAWECYPSKNPSTFTRGYCPQFTGQYHGNKACDFGGLAERTYNPRCDPANYNEPGVVVDVVGAAGHVAFHVLSTTLALHVCMIPGSLAGARLQACIDMARRAKRD